MRVQADTLVAMRWALALVLMVQVADANPAADAGKAFQAFVDRAAKKQVPGELAAFVTPIQEEDNPLGDLDAFAAIVPKPAVKLMATHIAKSGTAAWIVATIGGATYRPEYDKTATTPLRASAFLTLDGGAWHVRAAHISGATPNRAPIPGCGNIGEAFRVPGQLAKGTEPVMKVLEDAFVGGYEGKGTSSHVLPALSNDKGAQMFGSAPNEQFTGGAAIKKIFKGWKIDLSVDDGEHSRAGLAPGGDLAWVATQVSTEWQCTSYRALFVLQKEGTAWKIVHQHYSEDVLTP